MDGLARCRGAVYRGCKRAAADDGEMAPGAGEMAVG